MRTTDELRKAILLAKDKPQTGYGGRVLPEMQIYADLDTFEERKAYQDAIEILLRSESDDVRAFAVDLCLGFFVFRDSLKLRQTSER